MKSPKKVKLSISEKEYISRIARTTGLDKTIVKQVFLSFITCITLDMYAGKKDFKIPYFIEGDIKVKKELTPEGGFKFVEYFEVKALEAFHSICTRLETKQSIWIEEFLKSEIRKEMNKKLK